MLSVLKKSLYFVVASYFAFWSKFVLRRWRPRIIVLTGSSGKTTLLHMVEAQIGNEAIYTHHANSSIGIPFHILGMESNVESPHQWLIKFVLAPFKIWRKLPSKKLYVVEADCDRPGEGKFIGRLLKPEVTLWVSSHKTHSMNFDKQVRQKKFSSHQEAIAYEFGYLVETATKLVVVNGDQEDILAQLKRIKPSVKVEKVSVSALKGYEINKGKTTYIINEKTITLPGLHPEVLAISLQLVNHLLQYLDILFDPTYKNFHLPPGRSSVFKGKKDVTIIDSTYNSNLASLTAILNLFNKYSADKKWLVLGDMLEQGNLEESEHQKFAEEVIKTKADNIILLGPRTKKYVYPILKSELKVPIQTFNGPTEVYDFLRMNIKGGETILFKGGRSLEGVIELLLADPGDAKYLVRREKYWVKQRQKRGLPK